MKMKETDFNSVFTDSLKTDDLCECRQIAFAKVIKQMVQDFCVVLDDDVTLLFVEAKRGKTFSNLLKLEIVLDFDKQS